MHLYSLPSFKEKSFNIRALFIVFVLFKRLFFIWDIIKIYSPLPVIKSPVMQKFCYIIALSVVLVACASSKKMLQKGEYDKAISLSVRNLNKNPGNQKELNILKEAYTKANFFDQNRIDYLKQDNRDQDWIEIYNLYSELAARQKRIEILPNSILNQFNLKNYNDDLINSRKKAADITYRDGLADLQQHDQLDARKAYDKFIQVKRLYGSYKDVDHLLAVARFQGMSNVLFKIENHSRVVVPAQFESDIKKVSLKDLNGLWVNFDTYPDSAVNYNYFVTLDIKNIHISPENVDRTSHSESRKIQEGTRYVLDKNGNVERDSLGNDIKVPNIVTVSANVTEIHQNKSVYIGGSVDYYDLLTKQMIKTEEVSVNAVFNHRSAVMTGNPKALSDSTKTEIKGRPIPFPSNEDMLLNAAALLKDRCKSLIYESRGLFQ